MRLAGAQSAAALKAPGPYAGLLVFGADWGRVRVAVDLATEAVLGLGRDPFRFTVLTREEHGRLGDEVGGMALGGGRKVVHVHDGGDPLAAQLEKLTFQRDDTLLLVQAGDLPTRSKLRAFAERRSDWGAIACPMGNAGQVASEIRASLAAAGLTVTVDALSFLAQELTGESTARQAELEKLVLYAGDDRTVDVETARLCCSSSMEATLTEAVAAAIAGQPDRCDLLLAELAVEGATGAGLLAALSGQVHRLFKLRLLLDGGTGAEEACRSLSPPPYPRQAAALLRDARSWPASSLEAVGRAIRDADRACKRAASPDLTIASRLLAAIASRRRTTPLHGQ